MSPLGAQWTNLGSSDTYKPRVKLERNTGQALAREIVIESAQGRQAKFKINDSTGKLEIIDVIAGATRGTWTMNAP